MTTAIKCQNLSRRYGDVEALKPLDLEVASGTVFGFLGRNGAGKTTTIRLLTGLARPTTGQAWVAGVETTGAESSAHRAFGYLPQSPAFYGWMTAREYLDMVGRTYLMAARERGQRIDEMLALVSLEKAARRRIGGFSGGMLQRLGLAQALFHAPPVLILDEPLSALDPAGRHDVLQLLERLKGDVTIFLSSHILSDIERICDTIGIIHEGELVLVSASRELLASYASQTMLLEVEPDSIVAAAGLLAALDNEDWLASATLDGALLRLMVTDPAQAGEAILPLVVSHEIRLVRFEWVRPTLEEVFLRVSQ